MICQTERETFLQKKICTKRIHLVFLVSRKTFYYLLCRDVWCTQTVATTYFYITKKFYNILCRIWDGWIRMMIHTCLFLNVRWPWMISYSDDTFLWDRLYLKVMIHFCFLCIFEKYWLQYFYLALCRICEIGLVGLLSSI